MSDENTTNAIDDKKTENETGTSEPPPDWSSFFIVVGRTVITTLLYYLISGCIVLYLSKVAFAGVIPSNPEFYPFTDVKNENKAHSTVVDANVVRGGKWFGLDTLLFNANNKTFSTKINFNTTTADKDCSNYIVTFLRDSPTDPKKAKIFVEFFSKVFFGTAALNNTVITYIFSFLYSWFAESLIILIAPILLGLLFTVSYLFNFIIFIYFYIVNVGSVFKEIVIDGNKVKYESLNFEQPFGFFWAGINFILWMILFWVGIFFYPPFMMVYSFITPLFIKGTNVTNSAKEKPIGFGEFCQNVLWYKGQFLLFLVSIGLLSPAQKYLGTTGFQAAILGLIFCIFILHFYNQLYNPEEDPNLSVLNANSNSNSNKGVTPNESQSGGKNKKRNKQTKKQKE